MDPDDDEERRVPLTAKYIFVTGGVVSSLGKGLAAASIASLLEARGFHVTLLKMDPYINVDAGTISPDQHGEVYMEGDGGADDHALRQLIRMTASGKILNNQNATRL